MRPARQTFCLATVAAVSVAVPAHAAPSVRVTGWAVTRVNQEVARLPPDARAPLCTAIPPVAVAPRLRWRGARPGTRVRLRLRAPGHAPRHRTIVLRRAAGRTAPQLTARDLGLREDAFELGLHRLEVRRGGRTLARASLRFVSAGAC